MLALERFAELFHRDVALTKELKDLRNQAAKVGLKANAGVRGAKGRLAQIQKREVEILKTLNSPWRMTDD